MVDLPVVLADGSCASYSRLMGAQWLYDEPPRIDAPCAPLCTPCAGSADRARAVARRALAHQRWHSAQPSEAWRCRGRIHARCSYPKFHRAPPVSPATRVIDLSKYHYIEMQVRHRAGPVGWGSPDAYGATSACVGGYRREGGPPASVALACRRRPRRRGRCCATTTTTRRSRSCCAASARRLRVLACGLRCSAAQPCAVRRGALG